MMRDHCRGQVGLPLALKGLARQDWLELLEVFQLCGLVPTRSPKPLTRFDAPQQDLNLVPSSLVAAGRDAPFQNMAQLGSNSAHQIAQRP